ncbi:hypothetical protein AGABI2DRAFT_121758 [Agaricus bisporus var. bisporus H97]|uniref:hypothetical protein n=1 Tax=Agaricus bisporus var. bisporus (strain H97 / ATCC MYA-4626 / FGSC 10389) TaxID=936046 RepID=UPI00029F7D76|nr:hypothetical protein AGABI2DRAFT_121758 [Agaricus bisporus var. bisporus H97]EKV43614.1 hypothetical protein AGABI2DRAFT_121758 [Agaricus bisporus var. bisporus H97]
MNHHHDNKKRKRVLLNEAEGFLPSKKSPPPQRSHVPKFQSSFVQASASLKKPMGVPSRGQELVVMDQPPILERKKPVSVSMSRRSAPPLVLKPTDPTSKVVKVLPPAFPLMPATTSTPMKPLHTPELPVISNGDGRDMKPLSTIPFSDISAHDDSILELSSILLQFQNPLCEQNQEDGLVSPQKNKHLRGGLAERASRMYKKSHTSLYLWRTAIESKPTALDSESSSDITFRVCKIIHTITTGSSYHKPSLSITLCRIHCLVPSIRPFTSKKHLVYVITKFSSDSSSFKHLKEGCLLHIWRPWHEIPLLVYDSSGSLSDPDDDIPPNASLPLPSSNDSSLSISFDDKIHSTVLLCSRFSIS